MPTFSVSVEVVPVGAAGLNEPVTPAGAPPRLNVTAPVKLVRVRVTLVVPLPPGTIVSADGERDNPSATIGDTSSGSLVVTKTSNVNVVTVVGTVNCHVLAEVVEPDASTVPLQYRKYSWFAWVNVPVPSRFATLTVPVPPVTVGPELKNTLIPPASGVVPSTVFIGCATRFSTVTLDANVAVPGLYCVPLDANRTRAP